MSAYQTILVEKRGPVEWLTLNRPERLNTLTGTMVHELVGYLQRKLTDLDTRVIVMRGAGRAFCAGLDIKERVDGGDTVEFVAGQPQLTDIVPLMRRIPQPIVALLHGAANGGGFAMALAADFRFAGASLKMNDAFARIGMSGCEMGVSYFLPRLVGLPVARELIYTGPLCRRGARRGDRARLGLSTRRRARRPCAAAHRRPARRIADRPAPVETHPRCVACDRQRGNGHRPRIACPEPLSGDRRLRGSDAGVPRKARAAICRYPGARVKPGRLLAVALTALVAGCAGAGTDRREAELADFLGVYQGTFGSARTDDPGDDINYNPCDVGRERCLGGDQPLVDVLLELRRDENGAVRLTFYRSVQARERGIELDLLGRGCATAIGPLADIASGTDGGGPIAAFPLTAGNRLCLNKLRPTSAHTIRVELGTEPDTGEPYVLVLIDKDVSSANYLYVMEAGQGAPGQDRPRQHPEVRGRAALSGLHPG